MDTINWIKLSELVVEAGLQAIITVLALFITFRIGQEETDRRWKRELRHQEYRSKIERLTRNIDQLSALRNKLLLDITEAEKQDIFKRDTLLEQLESINNKLRNSIDRVAQLEEAEKQLIAWEALPWQKRRQTPQPQPPQLNSSLHF